MRITGKLYGAGKFQVLEDYNTSGMDITHLLNGFRGVLVATGESETEVASRFKGGNVDITVAPTMWPTPPGYKTLVSMGNSGFARDGVRVADDVIGAWAHYWGMSPDAAKQLRLLLQAPNAD